jgi:hypothetical protein
MTQAISPDALSGDAPAPQPLAHSRPILADPAAAEARFHARHPVYRRLAHHTIQTAELTLDQTIAAIVSQLTPAHASARP